jgi:leucyl aminopeptidase
MKVESAFESLPGPLAVVGIPVLAGTGTLVPAVAPGGGGIPGVTGTDLAAGLDASWCKGQGFTAQVGQTLTFRSVESAGVGDAEPTTVLVGVGDAAKLVGDAGLESLRRAAAAFVRAVGPAGAAGLVLPVGLDLPTSAVASALSEGAVLAAYRFVAYRTGEQAGGLDTLVVLAPSASESAATSLGAARGARLAQSVNLARDLVNEPPSSLTPSKLAGVFLERFRDTGQLSVEVWDEDRIASERLGGLIGVARGSTQPPRLVRVEYRPADPLEVDGRVPHVVLVGKGITFDSGGLSLKTAGGMETMKTDMGGAAAVLAAMDAAAALGVRIRITAIAPLTENMPSGSATKPGDVLVARNGKTIEVLNTDAEGRLVLADALSLAAEAAPDAIVDLATLTGAAVVALGKEIGGLLGNNDRLSTAVQAAGTRAGESLWPLPLPDDYRCHIDSEIADMRNIGRPGQAGTISAALLLREFVGDVPWAHLDIAGPARSDDDRRYFAKGGTGFGVRTLVELVSSEEFARELVALRG